jgi:hypothetical protein
VRRACITREDKSIWDFAQKGVPSARGPLALKPAYYLAISNTISKLLWQSHLDFGFIARPIWWRRDNGGRGNATPAADARSGRAQRFTKCVAYPGKKRYVQPIDRAPATVVADVREGIAALLVTSAKLSGGGGLQRSRRIKARTLPSIECKWRSRVRLEQSQ